ncbi:hypothetical protein CPB84DRAFT_1675734 [Gymnopilus junonius]|uniref:RhoGAP-domain-containing protein n=1 Tax=Gymnopilus junonius TaxID=109634 RepID=A0A9P5NU18_GYMJU|nr:hypothetical protein CPB84DRAFT_1675734 [Gymnopilus junonius]
MLATVPHDIPLREHSHLDLRSSNPDPLALEDRLCPGCKNSVVNEQGGLVVAFGQSFFHVDCFKCAKCRNQVTADTNLLLLSDGSPICANCSYSCNICHLPILDEAIMTGDDSYHAHCFKCKVCSNRIDELVFAKTSQGIYCMNCHSERMIKIRKHAQKKAEREKANGGSASSRTREYESRNYHRDQDVRMHSLSIRDNFIPNFSPAPLLSQSPSITIASISDSERDTKQTANTQQIHGSVNQVTGPLKSNTLPITPIQSSSNLNRRSSYDDGTRLLNVLPRQDSLAPEYKSLLTAPSNLPDTSSATPRGDRRRSINPGLSLSPLRDVSLSQSSNISTRHTSPLSQEHTSPNGQSQQSIYFQRPDPGRPSYSSPIGTPSPLPDQVERHVQSSSIPQNLEDESSDNAIVMSPPAMVVELQGPAESSKALSSESNGDQPAIYHGSRVHRSSVALSPADPKRVSSTSTHSADTNHSGRSSFHADVPRGVESGTDTETENDTDISSSGNHDPLPPVPPPKDSKNMTNMSIAYSDVDLEPSEVLQLGDMEDDMGESLSVERTSHTTFIAPALPPIRFSMNAGEFSELFSSVGGLPSLKSLDSLAKITRDSQGVPSTPPPTASSINSPSDRQIEQHSPDSVVEKETNQNPLAQAPHSTPGSEVNLVVESQTANEDPANVGQTASSSVPTYRRTTPESDVVVLKLRETLDNAKVQGARYLKVDINFVEAIVDLLESRDADYSQLKNKVDGMNRESKRYIDGLTVAQTEYDRELKARRDAEAEVTRLRVLLSGQAVRLTALSGDTRRQELRQQISKELNDSLAGLEHDLSRLKVERDVAMAEVEELAARRSTGGLSDAVPTNLGRTLTKRLESIRNQYQRELEPLTQQKEILAREIAELKAVRDVFLEETSVLNARNEELAQLSAVYARRIDIVPETPGKGVQDVPQSSTDAGRSQLPNNLLAPSLSISTSGSSTVYDENQEPRSIKSHRSENELHTPAKPKFKWPGSKSKEFTSPAPNADTSKSKARVDHNFQQLSILRFTRCDHCGDKMWGSQLRCTVCSTSIHVRCIANVQTSCAQHQHQNVTRDEQIPLRTLPSLEPSMFGRDLSEQVQADSKDEERHVPVIVEKCIEAVEARALDYEGIYRKTGGSGQSKAITQMFERGDYDSFDLCDIDRFNDICSVTSVLKTYFRSLPIPLLTFDLHDQFTAATAIRDLSTKHQTLHDLVHKLPDEHFFTLRMLMLHLHRIHKRAERNLMNARNLGVVFGPTLMRSRDPGAEFSDMAGKALFIEWLVENAPRVFELPE